MKNESGRSMVEMLGVLAIIGVLSIGGIAGYTLAMRRYKANEVVNLMSMASIYGMSARGGQGIIASTDSNQYWANVSATDLNVTFPSTISLLAANNDGDVTVGFAADQLEVCEVVADILGKKTREGAVSTGTQHIQCSKDASFGTTVPTTEYPSSTTGDFVWAQFQ